MKNAIRYVVVVLAAALCAESAPAAETSAETSKQRDPRLAWWREERLGLFVHWGPVSLTGHEIGWSRGTENAVYLQVLNGTGDAVERPPIPRTIARASLLQGGAAGVEQTADAVRVTVAGPARRSGNTVVELELEGPAMDLAPIPTPNTPEVGPK